MERLQIILAVLTLIAAGTTVAAMVSRGRRPPLRMDNEFPEDDTDLLIGPTRRSRAGLIDHSAQILEPSPAVEGGHPPDGSAPEGGR